MQIRFNRTSIAALLVLLIISFVTKKVIAHDSFRTSFNDASKFMDKSQFENALPLWLNLCKQDSTNANLNFKIGICYLKSAKSKTKAIPYLKKAAENTATSYDIFRDNEKHAPVEAEYYLAKAYQFNLQFDSAKKYYNEFLNSITRKHPFYARTVYDTASLSFAINAVKHPEKIKIKNLGSAINSIYPEYGPIISSNGSKLFFTSRRLRSDNSNKDMRDPNDGKYFEDIYESDKINGKWSAPKLLKNIDTQGHEAALNLSPDGKTLYIYKDDDGDGNIYKTTFDGTNWSEPTELPQSMKGRKNADMHVAITPDGKQMYFISNRKGSIGEGDIWYCDKQQDGTWGTPQNAGDIINTKGNEIAVAFSKDGNIMYITTNGQVGMGGYDIFYSQKDQNGKWQKPVNMGYPINSTGNDIFFDASTNGKEAYYSSERKGGYGYEDIYQFSLNQSNNTKSDTTDTLLAKADSTKSSKTRTTLTHNISPNNTINNTGKENINYQIFFSYNKNKISVSDADFRKFIKEVTAIIKKNDGISLTIESSASKVPTKTYVTNEHLAHVRVENARVVLLKALKTENVTLSKVKISIKALVQGPDYSHDPNNRKKYHPYQYTKIY